MDPRNQVDNSEIIASLKLTSGQITLIPKPELRRFWGDSLTKPPFGVTSAEVAIICPVACKIWTISIELNLLVWKGGIGVA